MSAEFAKSKTDVTVLNANAALDASDKSKLSHLRSQLHTLRTNKEREQEEDMAAVNAIKARMEKRERELYVIRGREQAITAAVRHLEDLGIAT